MTLNYPVESEEGHVEYKLKLLSLSEERLEHLATQMNYRLNEKGGEAVYVIGVSDKGEPVGLSDEELEISLKNLQRIAERIGAKCTVLREANGKLGKVVEVLVRRYKQDLPILVTITTLGQANHGKTTTVGVLVTGQLDDGDGLMMMAISRYKHEILMRRTSSVNEKILGFDVRGNPVNYDLASPLDEASVFLNSSKVVSFVDIGGHERYLRTAAKGILSHSPDYGMLILAANAGVKPMTKEHMGIAISFRIPFFVVVTKVDLVPQEKVAEVVEELEKLLKLPGISKIPFLIRTREDAILAARHMPGGKIAPIFTVSNKTGENVDLVLTFLNLLPPRMNWKVHQREPFLLYVSEKYNVTGVGLVVAGLVLRGVIRAKDRAYIGPFHDGSYRLVRVKSIQIRKGIFCEHVAAGTNAAFAIDGVDYDEVEKGMVLLDAKERPYAIRRFKARIFVLHHPTTIKEGYQSVFHFNAARVPCKFVKLSKKPLRTGDRASAVIEALYKPFYGYVGQRFLFREGRTRGVGVLTEILDGRFS